MHLNRRTFMQALAAAGALGGTGMARAVKTKPNILFGLCAGPDKAEKLKAIGYSFLEGGVARTLKPETPDAEYAPELANLKACALPFRSCNGFIPGKFRLTGPEPTHAAALDYAVKACQRADEVGIPFIVLGSAGARNVPEGFDMAKGKAQFIAFCQKLGDRIKDCKVTVVLEPLNKGESNILNSVAEGIEYVDAIRRPRIQLLADFYHMLKESEGPDSIRKAGARLRHCHIAELEGRKAPGTKGEDLSGFFAALKAIGYVGGVSCECGWPKENVEDAWKKALETMRRQAGC
ncbi:MAG: sugar phosphate isomerase/epimerase [Kiritimatiellae bacterium]|nr:sugar phosphate isomerase/epimerase [Kiritimatiellia bacterium]